MLESSPLKREFPRATVNIFKHSRLYSCEVHYRNINKRKFDKKFRIEQIFYRVVLRSRAANERWGEEKLHWKKGSQLPLKQLSHESGKRTRFSFHRNWNYNHQSIDIDNVFLCRENENIFIASNHASDGKLRRELLNRRRPDKSHKTVIQTRSYCSRTLKFSDGSEWYGWGRF